MHYLTQDMEDRSHVLQAELACQAGCKWVQYRCLTKSDAELLEEAHQIAAICDDWGATLIITNHVHLMGQADIQGVHIEDIHADFQSIRMEIGEEKTLGASAHTLDDIKRIAASSAVDYIGCGPFGPTDTKPNEYPILGLHGYRLIAEEAAKGSISTPILAVGGIELDDVEALLETGVYGVAVSAAVNKSNNPSQAFKEIYRKVY